MGTFRPHFDMIRVALWMPGKEKRIRERRRAETKMTGTSFLTGTRLVDGKRQNVGGGGEGSGCVAFGR